MMKMDKKAQMSIFILVGVGVFIASAVAVYFYTEGFDIDTTVISDSIEGSAQTRPLETYIISCISDTAEDAVNVISKNAGYIDPYAHHRVNVDAHESEMIVRSSNHMPYWYSFDSELNKFESYAPPLTEGEGGNSIEEQISNYVDDNIDSCFNDFESFSDRFDVEVSSFSSSVTIADETISVEVNMPTDVESLVDDTSHDFEDFFVQLDVGLGRLYKMASDIVETQSEYGFLERPILEMLSMQQGLGKPLPPFYEVQLFSSSSQNIWVREEVHDFIRRSILPFTSELQIMYTSNYKIPERESEFGIPTFKDISSQDLVESSLDGDYTDLRVDFQYPIGIPPYIKVGEDNPVLRPNEQDIDGFGIFSDILGALIRRYQFPYDISYPVVARVCDKKSFNRDGLCLYFAMEGNIRGNEIFFPASRGLVTGSVAVAERQSSLDYGDPENFVEKEIEFEIKDSFSGDPVDGADVYYICGEEYHVGRVDQDGDRTRFSGEMPFCAAGGRIAVRHEEYKDEVREWNNREGQDVELREFEMERLHDVLFDVKWTFPGGTSIELPEDDVVIIEISKIKDSQYETDVPLVPSYIYGDLDSSIEDYTSIILDAASQSGSDQAGPAIDSVLQGQAELADMNIPEDSKDLEELDMMSLTPGEYEVTLTHISYGDPAVNIPEEEFKTGVWLFRSTETLPEINFPLWVMTEMTYEWELGDELYENDIINFYVPERTPPMNYDQLSDYNEKWEDTNSFLPSLEVIE